MGKQIDVVAGILGDSRRVLLTQRPIKPGSPLSGLWEFPGGKVDPGESREEALVRELREELCIEASGLEYFTSSRSTLLGNTIDLHFYFVLAFSGIIKLTEHKCALWLHPGRLGEYPMPPGDLEPVKLLQRRVL